MTRRILLIFFIILSCKAFSFENSFPSYPAQVIDLTNWKVTLPIDEDINGSPDEILQPNLDTYTNSSYFHVNTAGDGVVFKAHAGGVTTSNSGYPRCELREMTNNGLSQANWSSSDGDYHIMELTLKITNLPVEKKHVVVAQIHDASDDIFMLRLETNKLFLEFNGTDGPALTTNYQVGTTFTFKVEVHNNEMKFYYNGTLFHTAIQSFSGAYFKAGMYTQSSCQGTKQVTNESCDAYGESEILALSTYHGASLPTEINSVSVYRISAQNKSIVFENGGINGEGTFALYNMQGHKLAEQIIDIDGSRTQINLEGFNVSGTFIAVFEVEGKVYRSKVYLK